MTIRSADAERVRNISFFKQADDPTFARAMTGAFLQRFPANTTLLMEGDPVDFLYILLEGAVELGAGWKSKDTTLAILRPVSTFILAAVVLESDSLMSAVTLERSEILMVPGDSLRRSMKEDATFGFAVSEELAGCYRGLVRSIKNHKLRDSTERLGNYLLRQGIRPGDLVAFSCGSRSENFELLFALGKIGAVAVPIALTGPETTKEAPGANLRVVPGLKFKGAPCGKTVV